MVKNNKSKIGKCIFCGTHGVLTQEHVFSNWLRRYIPKGQKKYYSTRGTAWPDRKESRDFKRPGDIHDWQVRCVCGSRCNNGWMRKLDEAAMPIIRALLKGEKFRLTTRQQSIVAAWATMKLMVAEHDKVANQSSPVTVHHMHRKYLMNNKLAPEKGWGIWIGHYIRRDWPLYWGSHPFLLLPDRLANKRPTRQATYFNGRVSTHVVGQLYIQILNSPMHRLITKWKFPQAPNSGVLYRIWPPTEHSILWPANTLTDQDADFFAGAFKDFLMDGVRKRTPNNQ